MAVINQALATSTKLDVRTNVASSLMLAVSTVAMCSVVGMMALAVLLNIQGQIRAAVVIPSGAGSLVPHIVVANDQSFGFIPNSVNPSYAGELGRFQRYSVNSCRTTHNIAVADFKVAVSVNISVAASQCNYCRISTGIEI